MGKRGGGGRPSSFSSFSLSTLCALCCLMVVISYTLSYSYFQTESGNSWLKDFSKNVGATWAKRQNAKVYKFLGVTYQSYFPLVILSLVSLCAGGSAGTGPSSSLWSLRKMISRRGCPPRGRPQQEPQPQLPPHNSPPSVTRPPPIYTNQRFTIIFLVLNCLYFSLGMYRHSKDWEKSTSEILSSIANFLALSGLVNMSFFLIPVSKHSPVLVAFNLPMEQSLYVHQLAGLTSIVFYVLHGVLHMIRFVTERGDEDSSSAPRLWRLLFPPVGCWCADYEVDVETSECISCCSGITLPLSIFMYFFTISLAPTDVAKILSFGNIGLGLIKTNFLKLKFLIALAQAPIFSDNCGLCNIKEILFLLIYLLAGALSLKSL